MRYVMIGAATLLAACSGSNSNEQTSADNAVSAEAVPPAGDNVANELIETDNGATVLRLEGNDSATFVGGDLVEVNRSK